MIRLLLADDHQLLREGLRTLLEAEADFHVVGDASDGRAIVSLAQELAPDVILMDIGMPVMSGVEATREICESCRDSKVIALSMHADRQFVQEVIHAGASGYLLKEAAYEELAIAVREVHAGRNYVSSAIASFADPGSLAVGPDPTAREREVLQLVAEGLSTKQIALQLKISAKTVETHRRQLMLKLDLHSVAELTKYAIRHGISKL